VDVRLGCDIVFEVFADRVEDEGCGEGGAEEPAEGPGDLGEALVGVEDLG